jgi:hypothetical protein
VSSKSKDSTEAFLLCAGRRRSLSPVRVFPFAGDTVPDPTDRSSGPSLPKCAIAVAPATARKGRQTRGADGSDEGKLVSTKRRVPSSDWTTISKTYFSMDALHRQSRGRAPDCGVGCFA